ncbi:DNA polymerase/3'-5' exonuclease PolX [Sporolactobacillus sp. THM7-4]|nr:DNA polymerase/3'-5' exonuclease PolX [Sporolactobacillus sp. THM7-4]
MNKKQIVDQLETIALYLEIEGENPFKIAAYRRAGQALERDRRSMAQITDLGSIRGIGKGTAQVIGELMATGESSVLKELQKKIPASLPELLKIPGLGGKKIGKLYQALGVKDSETLRTVCEKGLVRNLPGFGKKTEEKILKAINEQDNRPVQLSIAYMTDLAEKIEAELAQIHVIRRFSRAGSLRRAKEYMKDLDFVLETEVPEETADRILESLDVFEVSGRGERKMTVLLDDPFHVSVDFRFAKPEAFVTTLHHFTGSKEHNVLLRHLAKERGEKISEYGVESGNGSLLTFSSEADFYHHFGLHEIPPEVREGTVEVERAARAPLGLLKLSDIKGDLHMHSTWSDGSYTVQEMADAMRAKGYEYACLTDHSRSLRVAGGLTEYQLMKQLEEVERINAQYNDFRIFSGVEMDILPDGRLDYPDDILKSLDFVIASIHSSFSQTREAIMKRLEIACLNPYVRLIAHPTGRMPGRRKGYAVDVDRLIELAQVTGTALELNASRYRLDLSSKWVNKAQAAGVKIAINTDSHSLKMIDDMTLGVQTAIRGWVRPGTVLNTLSRKAFEHFLKKGKNL